MIEPTQIIERFFEVFDKSSIHDFRLFLARNSGVTKWVIAGDYCLHDKGRPNGAFVFSIIPYDDFMSHSSSIETRFCLRMGSVASR
jgi:hypothetical protein